MTRICQSMSEHRKTSTVPDASAASKRPQNAAPTLRPLAPKPLPPASSRPLAIRTTTPQSSGTAASSSQRRSPASCTVCYRLGCQLPTHAAFANSPRSSSDSSPDKLPAPVPHRDPVFTSSYAYRLGQQYVDPKIAASKTDPHYDLPLSAEMNTPEMHRLFHSWFTAVSPIALRVPRPLEIVGDFMCGPFFLPALQDPLLCMSVLAASAASLPQQPRTQPQDVLSLTLLGQAIQQMQERIKSDPTYVSDTTIVAAVFIWVVNIFLGDADAMISHSKSIYAFVETRGGLQELGLDGAVERFIRWVDAVHSFVLPVSCHYFDPPEPAILVDTSPPRYGLYWNISDTTKTIVINADVAKACQDACRLIEHLERVDQNGISGIQYVGMTQRVCVLFTKGSVLRAESHRYGHIDECISVSIALILFHCFCGCERIETMAATNVARLVKAIKATGGPTFWKQDLDLLIWLLFIVVMIPTDLKEKSWCLPFLCRAIVTRFGQQGKLQDRWVHDLRDCLHRFAWSELRLKTIFRETCQLIRKEVEEDESESEDMVDGEEEGTE